LVQLVKDYFKAFGRREIASSSPFAAQSKQASSSPFAAQSKQGKQGSDRIGIGEELRTITHGDRGGAAQEKSSL
jgi:hypothetical protein